MVVICAVEYVFHTTLPLESVLSVTLTPSVELLVLTEVVTPFKDSNT